MKVVCGIYKITAPDNRIYIGQSRHIYKRIVKYKNLLCERQPTLFKSLLKHGWVNHKFEIIHQCDESDLNQLEKYYVDLYNTVNSGHGLNLKEGGGCHGKLSEEAKQKLRKPKSAEHKRKLSIIAKARTTHPMLGKKHSQETIAKISASKIGKGMSEKTKLKMSEARVGSGNHFYGKRHSVATKEKISKAKKGKKMLNFTPHKLSEATKLKISLIHKGWRFSDDHKRKLSESLKGRIFTEEHRKNLSESLKKWYLLKVA